MKLKNNKGVTLTSIAIYVIALTITVIIITRISTYFYQNVNKVSTSVEANSEYTKFNSYFTDEINLQGNEVIACSTDSNGMNYIIFSKTKNQYSFYKNGIYRNKVKIIKNVDSCQITYDSTTKVISVIMMINNKTYSTSYTVTK